jgi:ECF sigma factor
MNDVTRIVSAIEQGDPRAADQLLPLIYVELRNTTFNPTGSPPGTVTSSTGQLIR